MIAPHAIVVALGTIACLTSAAAQPTIYRCGPQGHTLSQQACPDGQRIDVRVVDQPSSEAQAAARAVALTDARLAEQLRRERHERDAQPPMPAIAIHGAGVRPAASAASSAHAKKKKKRRPSNTNAEGDFIAVEPRSVKATSRPN